MFDNKVGSRLFLQLFCYFSALLLFVGQLLVSSPCHAHFDIPPQAPANIYGNILIDRTSSKNGKKPVVFSHWQHRMRYTCRICHGELDFNFKVNTTEITEAGNLKGRFCGACHNGKTAFASAGNCDRCHSGNIRQGSDKFASYQVASLPKAPYGNGIDWVESYRSSRPRPASFFNTLPRYVAFSKKLVMVSAWSVPIPPAIFPHKEHNVWLDCESCHPEPFNVQKKTTKNFSMVYLLKGEFCGVCHTNVAFPMHDCDRCHPKT